MPRGLTIFSALAIASLLSVDLTTTTTAYASCKSNYENCEHMAILVCRDSHLGNRDFVGGSDDESDAEDIAWRKADKAGYNANRCRIRKIINKAE